MIYQLDPEYLGFPDPEEAEPEGIGAIGGDLSPQRLINAYSSGFFPWYNAGDPIMWWSLDPRMVLFPKEFRCSKSLCRVLRSGKFEVRVDTCFDEVMRHCGSVRREGQDSTWVTEEMVEAYVRLHRLGVAHSFETFHAGVLVGGLYGVSLGQMFCGESMFHLMTDASKVALAHLVDFSIRHNFRFIDAQQETPHLASLGARPIKRKEYLAMLGTLDYEKTLIGSWSLL